MLCEPRLSAVMRARGDIHPPEFHKTTSRRERKKRKPWDLSFHQPGDRSHPSVWRFRVCLSLAGEMRPCVDLIRIQETGKKSCGKPIQFVNIAKVVRSPLRFPLILIAVFFVTFVSSTAITVRAQDKSNIGNAKEKHDGEMHGGPHHENGSKADYSTKAEAMSSDATKPLRAIIEKQEMLIAALRKRIAELETPKPTATPNEQAKQ